jgi:hypothetical protein
MKRNMAISVLIYKNGKFSRFNLKGKKKFLKLHNISNNRGTFLHFFLWKRRKFIQIFLQFCICLKLFFFFTISSEHERPTFRHILENWIAMDIIMYLVFEFCWIGFSSGRFLVYWIFSIDFVVGIIFFVESGM